MMESCKTFWGQMYTHFFNHDISTQEKRDEVRDILKAIELELEKTAQMEDIKDTLKDRGTKYGEFANHALLAQELKRVMHSRLSYNSLAPDQKECLEMIQHKVARILNGDPNYIDSWVDISGYATLVATRLDKFNKPLEVPAEVKKAAEKKPLMLPASSLDLFAGRLYAAYCHMVGGVAFNGDKLPAWNDFRADASKKKQSDGWIEVARVAWNYCNDQ